MIKTSLLALCLACLALAATAAEKNAVAWHDASNWKPVGRAWDDTPAPFSRLPARAQKSVPKSVWLRSLKSAGLYFDFKTDATVIQTRIELTDPVIPKKHSAASASGLDLYARDPSGTWRWAGVVFPSDQKSTDTILSGAIPGLREYRLYLPPFNTIKTIEIGVPTSCRLEQSPLPTAKPIVYYGTSIIHGYAASRPGMSVTALLGRKLNRPVINLGFSGVGKMEPAVVDLVAEIDAAVFVIDCLPNMSSLTPPEIIERAENGLRVLRARHPKTPIILLEDRTYANSWIKPSQLRKNSEARAALRVVRDKLARENFPGLTYLQGEGLFGDDDDATVDGSHPTDLGIARFVERLLPLLRSALAKSN
ncbi:MAG: SGNH/GDSL hydrolase family protein [Opitutaceae bacterium]|nr:SGNH/GDSL hydrolase family protein [Opitutaceae bacterium]